MCMFVIIVNEDFVAAVLGAGASPAHGHDVVTLLFWLPSTMRKTFSRVYFLIDSF